MIQRIKPPISNWILDQKEILGYTGEDHKEKQQRQAERDLHFISIAFVTAMNLSKDPSSRVGALVVSPDGRQLSTGYNGFPAGVLETSERWERPKKYEFVIHAEMNAILNSPFDTRGCTIYTTFSPCHRCLGHIINAGIVRVVYYGHDPKYPGGKYVGASDEDVFEACANRIRIDVVPENDLIESIRKIYYPGV